jgi:hypothetical protein
VGQRPVCVGERCIAVGECTRLVSSPGTLRSDQCEESSGAFILHGLGHASAKLLGLSMAVVRNVPVECRVWVGRDGLEKAQKQEERVEGRGGVDEEGRRGRRR